MAKLSPLFSSSSGNCFYYASGGSAVSPQARTLAAACGARRIYTVREYLKKALEYARSNVSPAAVCGYLSWALR